MALINEVYDYIVNRYSTNEPIFLAELDIPDMKPVSVRQQIKKLTEDGTLKRFDTGIYYIPQKTIFRSGSTLSVDDVIRKNIYKMVSIAVVMWEEFYLLINLV